MRSDVAYAHRPAGLHQGRRLLTVDLLTFVRSLIPVVGAPGALELGIYHNGFDKMEKENGDVVTLADHMAEELIEAHLAHLAPGIPIVAEEATAAGKIPDISSGTFFLVDPLDGTREFVKRSGDFTVNIGLLVGFRPVMGIIYAPLCGALYFAGGAEAYTLKNGVERRMRIRDIPDEGMTVLVGNRPDDMKNTAELLKGRKVALTTNRSSSLKFCAMAAGEADIYPRIGRTAEWDTAAADAILRAAGGRIVTMTGADLAYGKVRDNFINPDFVSFGAAEAWPLPERPNRKRRKKSLLRRGARRPRRLEKA
jgi:3'(2'), 5'-bisphosphate nucleotidase